MFLLILGKEEGRGVEKNIYQLPPIHTSTGDQTHNLDMCPDWEFDPQPFGVQDNTPTNGLPGRGYHRVFLR